MLQGNSYDTLSLTDYKVYSYGTFYPDDQFDEVLEKMKAADVLVLGSPLY